MIQPEDLEYSQYHSTTLFVFFQLSNLDQKSGTNS